MVTDWIISKLLRLKLNSIGIEDTFRQGDEIEVLTENFGWDFDSIITKEHRNGDFQVWSYMFYVDDLATYEGKETQILAIYTSTASAKITLPNGRSKKVKQELLSHVNTPRGERIPPGRLRAWTEHPLRVGQHVEAIFSFSRQEWAEAVVQEVLTIQPDPQTTKITGYRVQFIGDEELDTRKPNEVKVMRGIPTRPPWSECTNQWVSVKPIWSHENQKYFEVNQLAAITADFTDEMFGAGHFLGPRKVVKGLKGSILELSRDGRILIKLKPNRGTANIKVWVTPGNFGCLKIGNLGLTFKRLDRPVSL